MSIVYLGWGIQRWLRPSNFLMRTSSMDSYSEGRRVRKAMSEAAGHDIRKLIAMINQRRPEVVSRIFDPGTKAEHGILHGFETL